VLEFLVCAFNGSDLEVELDYFKYYFDVSLNPFQNFFNN